MSDVGSICLSLSRLDVLFSVSVPFMEYIQLNSVDVISVVWHSWRKEKSPSGEQI